MQSSAEQSESLTVHRCVHTLYGRWVPGSRLWCFCYCYSSGIAVPGLFFYFVCLCDVERGNGSMRRRNLYFSVLLCFCTHAHTRTHTRAYTWRTLRPSIGVDTSTYELEYSTPKHKKADDSHRGASLNAVVAIYRCCCHLLRSKNGLSD